MHAMNEAPTPRTSRVKDGYTTGARTLASRSVRSLARTRITPNVLGTIKEAGDPMWQQYVPTVQELDIVDDQHMQSRGAIVDLCSWEGESRKVVGVPWRFSRTPGALETWTPKLGQHNEYVFGELLGLDRTEIDALVEQEVIY